MSDLLDSLNPEQRTAVTLPDGSALILAGAGSGKTRVLTTRIAWLIQTGQIRPFELLAVTFTNKAAREMVARLSTLLPIDPRGLWMGTFHGLCNRMLRIHAQEAGLPPGFQILDMGDQLSLIKRLLKEANVDTERYSAKALQAFINNAKDAGIRANAVQLTQSTDQKFAELYALYEANCQRAGVVDFAELLLRCYELLSNDALRAHYQARFKHVLVDEFQDTNPLQYAWLKRLVGHGEPGQNTPSAFLASPNAVFAVGDDDQSIYAFRGANVDHMLDFEREFQPSRLIKLEQNYRSDGFILEAANQLISNNTGRLGKNLRTDAGSGDLICVYPATTDLQEANWVVESIREKLEAGCKADDLAILYRSNAQSRVLEHALFQAGIAYRVYGGLRFFERQEIKHALAYLRLIDNPNDDTAWMRIVNFPTRGIGQRTLEQLLAITHEYACSMSAAVSFMEASAPQAKVNSFARLIDEMRQTIDQSGYTLPEAVTYVLKASNLIAHYEAEREGQERLDNLQELINAASVFVTGMGYGVDTPAHTLVTGQQNRADLQADPLDPETMLSPLSHFLAHAALEAGDYQAQTGQAAVQLMTVHAAKGLEFSAVWMTGLEEGLFPHENSLSEAKNLEEERRLMYVAITRAKKSLSLSFANSRMLRGQTHYHPHSRFLNELPERVLKWLTPKGSASNERLGGIGKFGMRKEETVVTEEKAALNRASYGRHYRSNSGSGEAVNEHGLSYKRRDAQEAARAQREEQAGLALGQRVFHAKFGEGKVIGVEGQMPLARAQVQFKRNGIKWLALDKAKLEKIE